MLLFFKVVILKYCFHMIERFRAPLVDNNFTYVFARYLGQDIHSNYRRLRDLHA